MTPAEIRAARLTLGERWGQGGPLTTSQMARLLRLRGGRGDETVLKWEEGRAQITGPVARAVELMLDGAVPRDLQAVLSGTAPDDAS